MRRFVAFCSVAIIGVAVLAGCGGSSSKTGTGGSSTTNAGGGGGSSSNDDFSQLVADASKQKYKVTYDSGDNNSLTYAQDGNGNSVFGEGDSQTFVSKGSTVTCNKSSDVDVHPVAGVARRTREPVPRCAQPAEDVLLRARRSLRQHVEQDHRRT